MDKRNEEALRSMLKENDLVEKWMTEEHPTAIQWVRPRLGPVRDRDKARLLSVTQRYADIVFIEDGILHIVEAKLKPNGGVVGQLLQYRDLLRATPEFHKFMNYPIKMIILTPYLAVDVVEFASRFDIKYEIWSPDIEQRKELKRKINRLIA